jgi:hypothetical protein
VFLYAFDLLELNGQDLRREPLEVRKGAASVLTKGGPGPTVQRALRRPTGGCCVPACLQARLRRHREQAAWFALSVGAVAVVEDEEPKRTRSQARSGGGLEQGAPLT